MLAGTAYRACLPVYDTALIEPLMSSINAIRTTTDPTRSAWTVGTAHVELCPSGNRSVLLINAASSHDVREAVDKLAYPTADLRITPIQHDIGSSFRT